MKKLRTEKIYAEIGSEGIKHNTSWSKNHAPGLTKITVIYERESKPIDPDQLRDLMVAEMGVLAAKEKSESVLRLFDICVDRYFS